MTTGNNFVGEAAGVERPRCCRDDARAIGGQSESFDPLLATGPQHFTSFPNQHTRVATGATRTELTAET